MQLTAFPIALCVVLAFAPAAAAQSLTPMHNSGTTPSDTKGFRLYVGNPYKTRMVFEIIPMDPAFKVAARNASVNFPEITMAPNTQRQVIVTFKIDPQHKERTIGVCVQPKHLEGTVLPRVCGTYTGRLGRAGG